MDTDIFKEYKKRLQDEMIKLGATDQELKIITDTIVKNAINKDRKPEDVAWALVQ